MAVAMAREYDTPTPQATIVEPTINQKTAGVKRLRVAPRTNCEAEATPCLW
jgi:hypothetical protein